MKHPHSSTITLTLICLFATSACAVDPEPEEGDELAVDAGALDEADSVEVIAGTGCTHSTGLYKYNGVNNGWATVSCSTSKSQINVNIWLTRNGKFATFPVKEKRCYGSKTCTVRISRTDDSGSDFWCTRSRHGVPFYTDTVKKTCHYL